MPELLIAAALVALICLAFKATRQIGVALAALLLVLLLDRHPVLVITALVISLGVAAFVFFRHHPRKEPLYGTRQLCE